MVAFSTIEAEYRALSDGAKEVMWIRTLMEELGQNMKDATTIYRDNQSSIKLVKNRVLHARTKHIELQHHYICGRVDEGEITVVYIHTYEQHTYIFTTH